MTWQKGQSGNLAGRPRGRQSEVLVRTAKERAELYVDQAFRLLSGAVRDKSAPMASRVSAASAILDRAYGKAPQDLTVRGSLEQHIIALVQGLDSQDVDKAEPDQDDSQPTTH